MNEESNQKPQKKIGKVKHFAILSYAISTTFIFAVALYIYTNHENFNQRLFAFVLENYFFVNSTVIVEDVDYELNKNEKKVTLKINNVNLVNKNNDDRSHIDLIETEFHLSEILRGTFVPHHTLIKNGAIYFSNTLNNNTKSSRPQLYWIKNFLKTVSEEERDFLEIENLSLNYLNFKNILIKNANLKVKRESKNKWLLIGDVNTNYKNQEFSNLIRVDYKRKEYIYVYASLPKLPLALFTEGFSEVLSPYFGDIKNHIDFTSNVQIFADERGKIQRMDLNITEMMGKYHTEKLFDNKHEITSSSGKISLLPMDKLISVKDFILYFKDGFNIRLDVANKYCCNEPDSKISIGLENFDMTKLDDYWPKTVVPKIREHVVNTVKKGTVDKANAHLVVHGGWSKGKLDEKDISAEINLHNAEVNYLKDVPTLKDVSAKVLFTAAGVKFDIASANLMHSKINKASLSIPFTKDSGLNIEGEVDGPLKDAIYFVKHFSSGDNPLQKFEHSDSLIKSALNFTVPFSSEINMETMKFKYNGTMNNLILNDLAYVNGRKINFTGSELNVDIEKNDITVSAKGELNGIKTDLNISKNLQGSLNGQANLKINKDNLYNLFGDVLESNRIFYKFGFAGIADLQVNFVDDVSKGKFKLDLSPAEIVLDRIDYKTSVNEKSILEGGYELTDSHFNITEATFNDKNIKFNGDLSYNKAKDTLEKLDVKNIISENNNFNLAYENYKKTKVVINGDKANLGYIFSNSSAKKSSKEVLENIDVSLKLKTANLANSVKFKDFFVDLKCNSLCDVINLKANINDNSQISLVKENTLGDKKHIRLYTDNLEMALKAFDFTDSVEKGKFTIDLISTDGVKYGGEIYIKDFKVLNKSVLYTILKLTSARGLFGNKSNHNAVYFENFKGEVEFNEQSKILSIDNGYGKSDLLAISIEGDYNLSSTEMDFKGFLTPDLYINNILNDIPIIRPLLGSKSKGIFGLSYSIKGNSSSRKINVNPLSILAPGFLKNIFNK